MPYRVREGPRPHTSTCPGRYPGWQIGPACLPMRNAQWHRDRLPRKIRGVCLPLRGQHTLAFNTKPAIWATEKNSLPFKGRARVGMGYEHRCQTHPHPDLPLEGEGVRHHAITGKAPCFPFNRLHENAGEHQNPCIVRLAAIVHNTSFCHQSSTKISPKETL